MYIYTHICICVCVCIYTHIYVYVCVYICIHIYVCIYVYTHIVYMCVYVYICMYICMCVYMCVYIFRHTHHVFFILSSVDGHLDCFHVLVILKNAEHWDTYIVSKYGVIFLGIYPGVELLVIWQFYIWFSEEPPSCFP